MTNAITICPVGGRFSVSILIDLDDAESIICDDLKAAKREARKLEKRTGATAYIWQPLDD